VAVSFGDVLLSESQVRTGPDGGDLSPGAGGWPTIRYFNKATGYDGAAYPKKTDKAMCDELGDEEYMEAYVTELGGASLCAVADGAGCTDKEKGFIEKWKDKPADDIASQTERLTKMVGGSMKKDLLQWVKQRLAILKQLAPKEEL
jgi:hypothetical protein